MGGLLCYSLLESCYLVVPFDVSFISPATILLLSLSLALMLLLIQFQGRLPTGLDWTGLKIIILIIPLFTLGSIYSTSASGAEQMPETNNSN